MGKKKGNPINGWVILDKPVDMGSTDAVAAVKRALNARKAGHGGTLDPFATGLLPIALGEATKTVQYVMDGSKRYEMTLKFGVETDTLDPEGQMVCQSDVRPTTPEIEAALSAFIGVIEQVPPAFSALKIDGKRAYDLARAGENVEMKPRRVEIDGIEVLDRPDRDHVRLAVACGKGTYIRSLGRDLAKTLGTVGSLTALRRTRVGPFTLQDAISLEAVEAMRHIPSDLRGLLAVEAALDGIPAMVLSEAEAVRLRNGQPVPLLRKVDLERIASLRDGDELVAMCNEKAIALATYGRGEIRPIRVLNQP